MRIREVRQKAQTEVNIKAEDGDRGAEDGDLATIMLSDGGLANPAFPSHDGIAPCGPSVSYSYAYSSPKSFPHSDTYSIPDSPPHSDTHSLPYSDINPHNDSHGNLIPRKMSFATQFIASSGNDCLKIQTDFEEAFVEAFPNIVKEHLCNNEQLSKSKVTNKELIEDNATLFHEGNFEIMDTDIPVATQPSPLLWNANRIMFGSFHQNDERFIDQSRGVQCTCNALCMLTQDKIQNSSDLDQILYEGDALYNRTITSLKAEGKFVHPLLSLEEIPNTVEIKTGQYFVEKQHIRYGYLVNTSDNEALPTLQCALETAFLKSTSVLLIIGAVCSAISKRNNLYVFFDSHSHGENGLASSDGTSIFMVFSCLEDLIAYLYAFYESMRIDLTVQFDLLPISIRKKELSVIHKKQPETLLEAYFHDQTLRQKQKVVVTKDSEPIVNVKKKKNRKEYLRIYMQNARHDSNFKAKELVAQRKSKQNARHDSYFKAKELVAQRKSKQNARHDSYFKAKELVAQRKSKQNARHDIYFKAKELVAQRKSKQNARHDSNFKAKELVAQRKHMHKARQDRDYIAKELVAQRKSKQNARLDSNFKAKELVAQRKLMHKARQDSNFKAKELVAQKRHKHKARQDSNLKAKELVAQRKSKQNARKNLFFVECERVKKQEYRKNKQKMNEMNEIIVLGETRKKDKIKFDDHKVEKISDHRYKDIKKCIEQFHSSIAVGPLYVCTCCHQTWFRKGVCMLKNINLPTSSRLYCTKFISVNDAEWICHTCIGAIRDGKVPKLSVANGMKWPDKPPELDLHQLEERLIALRIPFMQIRELPRGGQYSLKGNVINVPVDIQPTINCLPRPMDENFTVAIQLKKKLAYKKVDFKENVRPLRVLSALHWLMNKSQLYKKSGIVVDESWFQEVTESSEDTVREFLEVSKESKVKNNTEGEIQEHNNTSENDTVESNDYDSDHYSEVDANEHVGNVDTLVDDADIDNKCDKVFTFAPGEGQHPLSLYQDKDAEYLCFPTIFCGQTPPSRDERLVPVHYSDIVKWELRSVDRRAAQSVPNIFFKHKKLQMKQISDKVNLAVRRCKKRGQKITAAEARDSSYVDKLVNLDEGYYIFRQLRNSPAYLETRKKDIFAMIRQLSLPTWFMSLSAADTRWTDLLKC